MMALPNSWFDDMYLFNDGNTHGSVRGIYRIGYFILYLPYLIMVYYGTPGAINLEVTLIFAMLFAFYLRPSEDDDGNYKND